MLRLAWEGKLDALRSVLEHHDGLLPRILASTLGGWNIKSNQTAARDIKSTHAAPDAAGDIKSTHAAGSTHAAQRRLLAQPEAYVQTDDVWTCAALQDSLGTVASAFWDTIAYYKQGVANQTLETPSVPYALPPENGGLAGSFADAITAGQGRRLVAAFVSDVEVLFVVYWQMTLCKTI